MMSDLPVVIATVGFRGFLGSRSPIQLANARTCFFFFFFFLKGRFSLICHNSPAFIGDVQWAGHTRLPTRSWEMSKFLSVSVYLIVAS